jgi:IS30 family transposase
MKAGHSQARIAELLSVHKSTIRRELTRNRCLRGDRPKQAHLLARQRHREKPHARIRPGSWDLIETWLRLDWSHEKISDWLQRNGHSTVNHERIYQYIPANEKAGGDLYRHLRCQKQRKKRYGARERRGQLSDRISIKARPAIVEQHSRLGDRKLDTITGKDHKQALVSLTERKSRLTPIAKVERKTADRVATTIVPLLRPHAKKVYTLTSDNGKEFAQHKDIAKNLDADFLFTHP